MNILKEKIAKAISNHVSLEDTYTYQLKRVKSAFEVGTMSLEDFEEWTEENVDDLAKAIVDVLQPQLNENQQKWINRLTINYSWYGGTTQHALHATLQEPEMPDLPQNEFAQVLEVFSKWVQEQEEANVISRK